MLPRALQHFPQHQPNPTPLALARYFGTSPQYWLNLQMAYELELAGQGIGPRIEREVLPRTAA
jgi:plasmid maintenance system antidote protein VapI